MSVKTIDTVDTIDREYCAICGRKQPHGYRPIHRDYTDEKIVHTITIRGTTCAEIQNVGDCASDKVSFKVLQSLGNAVARIHQKRTQVSIRWKNL